MNFNRKNLIDKECLICLESIDVEEQNLIKLPCNCSNSIYHISCITTFINSGNNKNFCPHCKNIYNIVEQTDVEQTDVEQTDVAAEQNNKKNGIIFVFHIFSNTIMNIINLATITDKNITEKVFIILTFCKVVVNFGFIIFINKNTIQTKSCVNYSYILQLFLLIMLLIIVSNRKDDFDSIILLVNNFFFFFGDLFFRIRIE
jgi:glutaredoxin